MAQQPVISAPNGSADFDFGGTRGSRRVASSETNGVFAVVELISDPGKGVDLHVHENEDELVHVVEGEIEVTLGDQKMKATAGVVALLPRGVPHAFVNVGDKPCRIMDVILPGGFDEYFIASHDLLQQADPSPDAAKALDDRFSVNFNV